MIMALNGLEEPLEKKSSRRSTGGGLLFVRDGFKVLRMR
jgi:hypothetical protein